MPHPTYRIIHTTAFIIPVVEHWLEREIRSRHYMGYSSVSYVRHKLTGAGYCVRYTKNSYFKTVCVCVCVCVCGVNPATTVCTDSL